MTKKFSDLVLNRYIRDELPEHERLVVWNALCSNQELCARLEALEEAFHQEAFSMAIAPPEDSKREFLAKLGFAPPAPPVSKLIHDGSTPDQFKFYLDHEEMVPPKEFPNIHSKFMFKEENLECYLIWLRKGLPEEVHSDILEHFLCLEGTCEVLLEEKVFPMKAGDTFHVPLHVPHSVRVTSDIPCKFICQREFLA